MNQPAGAKVHDLTVQEVRAGLETGEIVLVDVREPHENAAERIPGGALNALQSFDPAALPDPGARRLVFYCRSGRRSVTASQLAQAAGLPYDAHMAGGILAWKEAGFDTERG
ncbi:MAG: rhodanese-like domain-containing protein [Bradyrhizobiaceae bacterium]|nr:rhodanese-like domain-containing protein [Bradyrhizobiaceae bacterium]